MKNSVRMALSLAILGWVSISSQTVQGQIPFSEDFTNATYNPNWIWHNSYSGSSNLLTGTALRIVASWQNGGSDLYWGSNSNAPCLFQPVNPHLDWIAETKIGISATNNAQGAAFVLANGSSNESPFSAIRVADQMCDGNGNNIRFNWDQFTQVYTNTNVYFRVQKSHTNYTGWYSSNGINWNLMGEYASTNSWSDMGVCAMSQSYSYDDRGTDTTADFYYFHVTSVTGTPFSASATATVVNGFVVGTTITDSGYGYTNTPIVTVVGGGGSGAVITATVSNQSVVALKIVNAGSGYTNTPAILIAAPRAYSATATAFVTNGFLTQLTVTDKGYGYSNSPSVKILGGGGSGAQATATVSNGYVIALTVINAGSGYTNDPSIIIMPPVIPQPLLNLGTSTEVKFTNLISGSTYQLQVLSNGTYTNTGSSIIAASASYSLFSLANATSNTYRLVLQTGVSRAQAVAQLVNGFVVGFTVTDGGAGYSSANPPSVTITGDGSGAAASAFVSSKGVVTNITVLSAGYGYTNGASVVVDLPSSAILSPVETRSVTTLNMGSDSTANSLVPYGSYQIQSAPSVTGPWSNVFDVLVPTAQTATQALSTSAGTAFFRLLYVP